MRQVNIHEAKTHLSRLADEAGAGETIILAKAGKPVAKIVALDIPSDEAPPLRHSQPMQSPPDIEWRRFGFMKGKIFVPEDFDIAGYDEIVRMFEGEE